ncbi:hypothetical protein BH23THE1_BH23THE1_15470 [soil metagenome]
MHYLEMVSTILSINLMNNKLDRKTYYTINYQKNLFSENVE